jgi:nuclear transport factor 2 (NTF2) superfamily protein
MSSRPPLPPFTAETAAQKARAAEDAWNTREPERVALAYTEDSRWRNRAEFINGRAEIVAFLTRKWARELDYRLIKEVWAFTGNRIAVRFAYEWHDDSGSWFRSYGNENWEFDEHGLMRRRHASINDLPIAEADRKYRWPLGRRPAAGRPSRLERSRSLSARRSVTALNQKAGIGERRGETRFDSRGLGARNPLQMQCRSGENLEPALEHAARGANACFVLVESLRRRVMAHAHIYAEGSAAPIAVVEQYEINVRSPLAPGAKAAGNFIDHRQPLNMSHRQPFRDRIRGALPETIESQIDVEAELRAHPELMDAMRPGRSIAQCQPGLEALAKLDTCKSAQRTRSGRCVRPVGRART